jgi:hypothetical protein
MGGVDARRAGELSFATDVIFQDPPGTPGGFFLTGTSMPRQNQTPMSKPCLAQCDPEPRARKT